MADEQQPAPQQQWHLKLDPRSVNCDIRLNGETVRGVTRVRVDADINGTPTLELTLTLPDLVIEGVPGQIIIERTEQTVHVVKSTD